MKKLMCISLILGLLLALTTATFAQNAKYQKTKNTDLEEMLAAITNVINIIGRNNIIYDHNYVASNAILHILRLFDSKAQIFTSEEAKKLKEQQQGIYYGTGMKIRMKGGMPLVLEVPTNSPAANVGIKGESVIVSIDGKVVTNLALNEVEALLKSDSQRELVLDIKQNLRSSETNKVRIKLEPMQLPAAQIEKWNHDINFIKLNYLFPGAGSTISSTIQKWLEETNSITGIIFDLRGTDGVDTTSVVELVSLFPQKEKILFTIRGADGNEQAKYQKKESNTVTCPVIVLIDKNTSGTAELLAAILAHTKGVMLIGEPTQGDNKVRSFIPFQQGKELYIATGEFVLTKENANYANTGVSPHITIKATASKIKESNVPQPASSKLSPSDIIDIFGNVSPEQKLDSALIERVQHDPPLRRAVDILLGLKALNITMRDN